jgi:tight adherence protein B
MAILLGGIALAIVILIVAAISIRGQRGGVVEERLGRYTEVSSFITVPDEDKKEKEKKTSALTERIEGMLQNRGFASKWRTNLARADLKLTVTEFLALHVIAAFGLALVAFMVLFPGNMVMTIVAGGVGLFLPRIYVNYKQGKRFHAFEGQLPDILGLWVNSLRSGYSVMQALEAISREAPDPAAMELRRVVQEVQLGIPMEESLAHLLGRMPSDDLDLVITAVNIQREVGGNLAEILEIIGHTIRERIKLKGEIRVLTSQGRITGYLISGLPILLAVFLAVINPDYVGKLFSNRLCGWPLLAIGLIMIGMGTAVIQKIVDIEI